MLNSLRIRFYLIAIATAILPLLLLGVMLGERSAAELEQQSLILQQELALRVEREISSFVEIRLHELDVVERTHLLVSMDEEMLEDILGRLLTHNQLYQSLMVLGIDGTVHASVSRTDAQSAESLSGNGRPFTQTDFWLQHQRYIGQIEYDSKLREPLLSIAYPVVARRIGEVVRVLFAQVRFKRIWDLLADLTLPQETEAFVVNAEGRVLAHRSPAAVLSREIFELPEQNGRLVTDDGSSLLVAVHPLSHMGDQAFVVVTRPLDSALETASSMRRFTLISTAALLLLAILLAMLHSRQFVKPIMALAGAARRIAAGELDTCIPLTGPQEMQDLGRTMQGMTDRLSSIISKLERSEYTERQRAMITLESIGDAVISTDAQGVVSYLNPIAEKMIGWPLLEAAGQPIRKVFNIVNEQTRQEAPNPVLRCLAEKASVNLANHTVLVSRSGEEYAIQDSAAPIRGHDDEVLGVVMVFSDVTKSRKLQREISHQAAHDDLTNLVNRREFESRLTRVIETAQADASEHALCYLDLDQFKVVNDTAGHAAGDELLKQIAALLKSKIRRRDTLARLGGDEFAVLMEYCGLDQAYRVSEDLRSAIEHFRFLWEGSNYRVGVSIGAVAINEKSESSNAVLRAADHACYIAKDSGRNRVHVYDEDNFDLVRRREEMRCVEKINQALEEDLFELHAQKIVSLGEKDGRKRLPKSHFEILVRLVGKDGERIAPGLFLPAAERFNLITGIDRWVVRNAFDWLAKREESEQDLLCSINISGPSVGDEEFLSYVLQCLDDTEVVGEQICFEITETAAIANLSMAINFIHSLRQRGCSFALDDFGSGLSSFAYLKSLPVQFLKIDGIFVKDMAGEPFDRAMVRAINDVGQLLGMQTIAEFVEDGEVVEQLLELGVDAAQGYHFSRPEPLHSGVV